MPPWQSSFGKLNQLLEPFLYGPWSCQEELWALCVDNIPDVGSVALCLTVSNPKPMGNAI